MEKKKQEKTMMSLMFPFIELGKGVQPYEVSSYEESGSYFVKDSQGFFHIIEVSKENNYVNGWCLHNNMASQLSYQLAVCPLTETMLELRNSVVELCAMVSENINLTDETRKTAESARLDIREGAEGINLLDAEIGKILAECEKQEEKSSKGFVSESTLVEIISTVRK